MCEHDDMSSGQFFRSDGNLLEFLHDRTGRGHEGSTEGVGVTLLTGVFSDALFQNLRLPPRRNQMPELVGCRLGAAIARVIAVEKNAGAQCFVVGEQAGNSAIDPPDIDAYAKFKLEERYNIGDRAQAQSEPLSQIECVLFSLG